MRSVVIFLAVLLSPLSAFALTDAFIDYCLTTKNPKACIQSLLEMKQANQQELQHEAYLAQLEQARIQANGLALFGSGQALIQGMNQGFQNMQLPYVNRPYVGSPSPHP